MTAGPTLEIETGAQPAPGPRAALTQALAGSLRPSAVGTETFRSNWQSVLGQSMLGQSMLGQSTPGSVGAGTDVRTGQASGRSEGRDAGIAAQKEEADSQERADAASGFSQRVAPEAGRAGAFALRKPSAFPATGLTAVARLQAGIQASQENPSDASSLQAAAREADSAPSHTSADRGTPSAHKSSRREAGLNERAQALPGLAALNQPPVIQGPVVQAIVVQAIVVQAGAVPAPHILPSQPQSAQGAVSDAPRSILPQNSSSAAVATGGPRFAIGPMANEGNGAASPVLPAAQAAGRDAHTALASGQLGPSSGESGSFEAVSRNREPSSGLDPNPLQPPPGADTPAGRGDGASPAMDAAAASIEPVDPANGEKPGTASDRRATASVGSQAAHANLAEAGPPANHVAAIGPAASGANIPGWVSSAANAHGTTDAFRESAGGSPGSTSAPGARETFAALDAGSGPGATNWIRAGAHSAEAGFDDPTLGWVSIRADLSAGGIHAAVVPGSAEAGQALSSHMEGLNAYLSEHRTPVETLTLVPPESRGADSGPGHGMSQSMHQEMSQSMSHGGGQNAEQRGQSDAQPVPRLIPPLPSASAPFESRGRGEGIDGFSAPQSPAGGHISVMA